MRVLIALTYYRPHYSGLTIYAERLAKAIAGRGHRVTVLTSRYDRDLPALEVYDGVEIIRLPVMFRVSKGVIMPSILYWAWKLARQSDVINLHVPQLDAAPIALIARLQNKPVVLTYHCDLRLPGGLIHKIANQVSHIANHISARAASLIVTNTRDYAENSPFLQRYLDKLRVSPPPVELAQITPDDRKAFREKIDLQPGERIIGMAARLATEKGVEYLVEAMPKVMEKYPNVRVLFVGQYQNVLGEEAYAARLAPMITKLGSHWSFLGNLPSDEFTAFFHETDVLVLPSINSTESFGMVQVEAMACGTPAIATDLPGVRQPVLETGMGKVVPVADADALAKAIITILDQPERYQDDQNAITNRYSPDSVARNYEELFESLILSEESAEVEEPSERDSSVRIL